MPEKYRDKSKENPQREVAKNAGGISVTVCNSQKNGLPKVYHDKRKAAK